MSYPACSISLLCKKTVLGKKEEYFPELGVKKRTTTYHPTFQINVRFGELKHKKTFECPYCGEKVKYKSYRFEFSLKKALKWVAFLIGVSVILLILVPVSVSTFDLTTDRAMWYFGLWGFVGLVSGTAWLIIDLLRYVTLYRENKYKYVFQLYGTDHLMTNGKRAGSWRKLPVSAP